MSDIQIKATNIRIDSILRALKNALDNCAKQEALGVPVSNEEKQLYASLGLTLSEMLNQSPQDFELNAHAFHSVVDQLTGKAQSQGQPQGTYANPISEADKMAARITDVVKELVAKGIPAQTAMEMGKKLAMDLVANGISSDDLSGVQVIKISKNGQPAPTNSLDSFLNDIANTRRGNGFLF